jgi:hypothetical protein
MCLRWFSSVPTVRLMSALPSSSRGAIHDMAHTGRSNVRYVDPQRRYTVVLGPSWNAPFGALPHDDRAGTHDSADGRCGSYASIGRGQAALWITSKNFVAVCSNPPTVRTFELDQCLDGMLDQRRCIAWAQGDSSVGGLHYATRSRLRAHEERSESSSALRRDVRPDGQERSR